MNVYVFPLLIVSLLAPIRTVSPDATKNKKSQVSRQSKAKRTVKLRRGNIGRNNRRRHNQKYELQRRRKAGGTITRTRNSRATNNRNNTVRKRNTNRRVRTQTHQQATPPRQRQAQSSKNSRSARARQARKELFRYQLEILLSDPEMGPLYRRIIESQQKSK